MSDIKTQRNVAIGVAALAVAFVAGYVLSTGRHEAAPVAAPQRVAAEPSPAAAAQPAVETEARLTERPAEAVAEAPERRTAPTAQAPAVGRRARAVPPVEDVAVERPVREEEVESDAEEVGASEPYEPSAPIRRLEPVTVPRSTPIVLDLVQAVSSETAQVGDSVAAELAEPIRIDGEIVVPAGTRVTGRVSEAQALKKVGGKSILALTFDRLESGDGGAAIAAGFRREGKSETGKDAATIGAGAAIGTILGNQAKKNDRGKVLGAIVGAAAGAAVAAKTEGERIELPVGARLELTLQQDVELMIDR